MAIKDLQIRQGKVDLVLDITDKEQPREFNKFGKTGKVCNATAKDETGTIKLTLWNEDVDKVSIGDKVHIINGYVNEWQGEPQLTTGKFGQLEIVESSGVTKDEEEEASILAGEQSPEQITPEDAQPTQENEVQPVSDEEKVE
jgi:replication factor A1